MCYRSVRQGALAVARRAPLQPLNARSSSLRSAVVGRCSSSVGCCDATKNSSTAVIWSIGISGQQQRTVNRRNDSAHWFDVSIVLCQELQGVTAAASACHNDATTQR
jgi:hypothetical protein